MKTQKLTENAIKEIFEQSNNHSEIIINTLKRMGEINSHNDIIDSKAYYDFETLQEHTSQNITIIDINNYKFAYSKTNKGIILHMDMNKHTLKNITI